MAALVHDPGQDHLVKPRVYLTRSARNSLSRLEPDRRAALSAAFQRVGQELLERGEQVSVAASWALRTWPRRCYPQQCYPKTLKYVREHADIAGMRLVHGVISHRVRFAPLDHAWVELPGDIVFDAVVQAFFTGDSYNAIMLPMRLDSYSAAASERLLADHRHPGPWNARWVPTLAQLQSYARAVSHAADLRTAVFRPRDW